MKVRDVLNKAIAESETKSKRVVRSDRTSQPLAALGDHPTPGKLRGQNGNGLGVALVSLRTNPTWRFEMGRLTRDERSVLR